MSDTPVEKRPRRRPSAFSLIELLVVISIIALLIALLLPSLDKARAITRTAICELNLREMGIAMRTYAADNHQRIVYDTQLTSWHLNKHQVGAHASPGTEGHLRDYLGAPVYFDRRDNVQPSGPQGVMFCPAYEYQVDIRGKLQHLAAGGEFPTNYNNNSNIVRSYRTNDWFNYIPAGHSWNNSGRDKNVPKISDIRNPSRLIVFAEGYNKNLFLGWGAIYFNPNHDDQGLAVRADGSTKRYTTSEATGGSGFPWSPNHGVNSTYAVETWGTYFHPDYTKAY